MVGTLEGLHEDLDLVVLRGWDGRELEKEGSF